MRSARAFVGAAVIVLSYPAAVLVQYLLGTGAETVVHLVTGSGFLIFATSVFDFPLPRAVNIVGAAAAGAFGAIFVMQGVADLTQLEWLDHVAFDVLGHHLERLLPDVVYLWFIALLLVVSRGWTRILGWAVMIIVVGAETATLIALLVSAPLGSIKAIILLPFVWLLFESGRKQPSATGRDPGRPAARSTPVGGMTGTERGSAELRPMECSPAR